MIKTDPPNSTELRMAISPSITNNFLDSCAFDPKYVPQDRASIELFDLYKKGKVLLQIVHSTQKEIEHPNTPAWVKTEAQNLIFTIQVQLTPNEVAILRKIETILAGNGRLRRGPRYVRQDIQVTLAPSVSRRVIPFAATVLRSGTPRRYRSRVSSLNDSTPSI